MLLVLDKVDTVDLASIAKTPTVSSTVVVIKEAAEIEAAVVDMAVVVEAMTSEVAGDEEVTMEMVVISEVATGTAILG